MHFYQEIPELRGDSAGSHDGVNHLPDVPRDVREDGGRPLSSLIPEVLEQFQD